MMDPELAQLYGTRDNARFLMSADLAVGLHKRAFLIAPMVESMQAGAPVGGTGFMGQIVRRFVGSGPVTDTVMGLMGRVAGRELQPGYSPVSSVSSMFTTKNYKNALNFLRQLGGQRPF